MDLLLYRSVVGRRTREAASRGMVLCFLFMMTTLATYKLDYSGYRTHAQVFGAIHLAMCVVLFLALPIGPSLYGWIALVDLVLFIFALRMCLTEWGSAEYALFWRHATAW